MFAQLFRSDLSKNLFRLALWGAGLASISMMIWTLGPLIEIGGYRPFENYLIRDVVIKDKMKDALATLKKAGGKSDYLYDLPWYLLIGPPGAGKTTALVNSGLKFPLSRGATPAAVAGVGGTRYCDWWFTEDAVLIDTAGRYTTQDSDAKSDKESWFSFLDLLKKSRPRQPINGVLIAISIEDILTM